MALDCVREELRTANAHRPSSEPPLCNTGVELTIHWLRGGFSGEVDVLELVESVLPGSYLESFEWGRFMYRKHHAFEHGLKLYYEPVQQNMPATLLECPGEACEAIGLEGLRTLFCNAELTRADIAADTGLFSPGNLAQWIMQGNVRTRAKKKQYSFDLDGKQDNVLRVGSRQSEQYLRVYDRRGFTRLELELKGERARSFKDVLLMSLEDLPKACVGIIRDYIDFVDVSQDKNVSRAPLLPTWALFTQELERFKLSIAGKAVKTLENVKYWLEDSVSAMLATYALAGESVGKLIKIGREKMGEKHRRLLYSQRDGIPFRSGARQGFLGYSSELAAS